MGFTEQFLDQSLFQSIVNVMANQGLFNFLFEAHIKIVCKLIAIFYCMSKAIYFTRDPTVYVRDEANTFRVLIETRNLLEDLAGERNIKAVEKPVLRSYLVALAFLQEKFKPSTSFLTMSEYKSLATGGFVRSLFSKRSSDFLGIGEVRRWEFINEFNEKEIQNVTRLNVPSNVSMGINVLSTYTIMYSLNNLRVIFSHNDDTRKFAYDASKYFMISIIYFGVDAEKVVALKCLLEYCAVEQIKHDISNEQDMFAYLIDLKSSDSGDPIEKRLLVMIEEFLALFHH